MKKSEINKEITLILKTLWNIRHRDKFYFKTYGREFIYELVKKARKEK